MMNIHATDDDLVRLWGGKPPSLSASNKNGNSEMPSDHGTAILTGRSMFWSHLLIMGSVDRISFINKVVSGWPYPLERWAMLYPIPFATLTCIATSSSVASKISAELFLLGRNASYLDALRHSPKIPFIVAAYTSAIMFYALQQASVLKYVYREEDPCSSCIITRSVLNGLIAGVIFPAISIPYVSYYFLMKTQKNITYPEVKNVIEMIALCWETSKATKRVMPKLVAANVVVGIGTSLSILWARKRIFDSLALDPDLVRDSVLSVKQSLTWKARFGRAISKIPYLKTFADDPADITN